MIVQPPVLRLLFASGSHDPFVEAVESELARALTGRHGQFLRVVEGRRPVDDGIPTIDLAQAVCLAGDQPATNQSLPACFFGIVNDTTWFEETAGQKTDRTEVESRLSRAAGHAGHILASFRPDAVLVWNGMLSQRAIIASLAREARIPVWYCERGALPGSWYADPVGINGGSSLVQKPFSPGLHEAMQTPLDESQLRSITTDIGTNARAGASAWGQPPLRGAQAWRTELGIPSDTRILFFPLQVDADTNMRFFSPHFRSSLDALRAVCDACRQASEWLVLAKPHPKGNCPPERVAQIVGVQGRCVADINLHDALDLATLVVTINSTVAAEAAWSAKPVLQLGRGILSDKQIVAEYEPERPMTEQLDEAVRRWNDEPSRFERSLRLFHYLRGQYLLQADAPADAGRMLDMISGKVRATGTGSGQKPEDVARRFAWKPAVDLIHQLTSRDPRPGRIILLGYGQNAMRLVHAARLLERWNDWEWAVSDDDPRVRVQAENAGLTWADPWHDDTRDDTTQIIVTPENAATIEARLCETGRIEGRDWLRLH